MYKNLVKISTVGMSHEEWLAHRNKSIGGSDAAALVGLNSWATPYSVWCEKLGMIPPKEDNEAMRQGRDLEDYVAQRFTEATGKRVRRENHIILNPDYPFAHANVDRIVIGEDAGLECKTTSSLNIKKFTNGEYPDHYYVQCVHYMMVTGAKRWYLAVLVFGKGFYHYVIERDEAEIEALARGEIAFWQYVVNKTPPTSDGEAATNEAFKTVYACSSQRSVDLTGYERDLRERTRISAQIRELERQRDECDNRIKTFMGDAGFGECNGYNVSWTSSERRTFDVKKFAADHHDVDLGRYYKTSTTRTFRITEREVI